jgi:opacity protein-like surface antigen
MKKLLIGAASSALLAPAAAHADTSGFVDTAYEYSETSGASADSWNLGAGIQHDFDGWGIQGDGRTTHFDNGSFTIGAGYTAVHAYTGLTQNADVAVFVGMLDFIGNDGVMIGTEARVEQPQWSLQGSLGYAEFHQTSGNFQIWDGRAIGSWFLNQDTALTPVLSYTEWHETNEILTQFGAGLGFTHRFNSGVQIVADYVHSDNDSTVAGPYQVDTWRLGVRINLNAGNLQAITNHGASWRGAAGFYEALGRF